MSKIDFNVVSQEPFVKASRELLGEHGCYPMVAYGTMKLSESFRNICRSHDLPYNEYNEVAKNIEQYVEDEKWKPLIQEAEKFVGSVVSASVHPCAHVLLNKDLRQEYGIVRIGDFYCVMMTSAEADEYKFLKNDYLIVSVLKLISETFAMIGRPIMKVEELLSAVKDNNEVWELYAKGMTATLNQCDGEWATGLIKRYKPKNLAELSMFISCLRPFFESSRETFINREPYSTGSKHLDEVLKASNSFILFQESLMQYFDWLGVTPAESIGLIKKISKKKIKPEDFNNLKERIKKQWIINTGSEDEFEETFQTIHDCMSYGFAAPHALGVAIDSLYGAYLKATYPLEYYTVCLNNYVGDDDRTQRLTEEAKMFGINISAIKFRRSDSYYVCDKENNTIYKGVASIKYLNEKVSHIMYEMKNETFDSFIDFLKVNPCNAKQTEILIRLNFFEEFGGNKTLLNIYNLFREFYGKKSIKKSAIGEMRSVHYLNNFTEILSHYSTETNKLYKLQDSEGFLKELSTSLEQQQFSAIETVKFQYDELGYIDVADPTIPKSYILVTGFNNTYSPRFTGYCLNNGKTCNFKLFKSKRSKGTSITTSYKEVPVENGDVIIAKSFIALPKLIKTNEGFVKDMTQKEWWINNYKKAVI